MIEEKREIIIGVWGQKNFQELTKAWKVVVYVEILVENSEEVLVVEVVVGFSDDIVDDQEGQTEVSTEEKQEEQDKEIIMMKD